MDPVPQGSVNLYDVWAQLRKQRVFILSCISVLTLAMALFTFLQPNIYQSTATLMPLGISKGGLASVLSDLGGGLPSFSGFGKESPTERLLAVLRSRTLSTEVIQSLDLLPRLFPQKWDAEKGQWRTDKPPTLQDALRQLQKQVGIAASKQGVVSIDAEHRDPVLAAAIANRYVSALQQAIDHNAFSLAKKNRLFIEEQLSQTRRDLTGAEEALQRFEQDHKIVSLDAQTKAAVETIAGIEGHILLKEVQLGVQQRLRTGASQEVYLLQEELRGLRGQLTRLQSGPAAPRTPSGTKEYDSQIWPSFHEAPEIKLRYARLQREALIQNKLFTLLAQQLEQAKIDEARDEIAFQLLDRAIPAERKSRPSRALNLLIAMLVGVVVGSTLAIVRIRLDPMVRTREQIEQEIGIPVVAALPALTPHRRPRQQDVPPTEVHPLPPIQEPVAEVLRYVYARCRPANGTHRPQTVLFASVDCHPHTSLLLAHLAVIAAQAGERTLLVDGHLGQPTLQSLWHCPLTPGVAETLATPERWQSAIQASPVQNLFLLPAGAVSAASFAILQSATWGALLAHFKETYEVIFCLAPPLVGAGDAAVFSRTAETTCLVLACGRSSLAAVREAKHALEALEAKLLGAILLDAVV